METLFERYKNIVVLSVVLLAQFLGLAIQVRTPAAQGSDGRGVRLLRYWIVAMMSPPEKVMSHTGSGVRGFWGNYIDLRRTREENLALRDEVDQLRLEQAALLEDAQQGHRLQALLGFQEKYVYKTVPAQVIGTGGSDQARVLYIDKGWKDGLKVDQPVITPDGIVGKVRDVFPHTAQVLEISDQTSGAGVILEQTRLRGVLRGNAYGQPEIIDVLPDDRIKAGERVVTSGGDQIFPRGLAVGTVQKLVSDPDREPYTNIVIKPAANLQHLEEVLIVTQTSDQLSPAAKKDMAKSAAAGAEEAELQRASDVLAEKLPGLKDPNAPETAEDKTSAADDRPLKPLTPIHADRYTPGAAPPAADLVPGKAPVITASARTAELESEGAQATVRPKKKAVSPDADAGLDANTDTGLDAPRRGASQPAPEGTAPRKPKVNADGTVTPGPKPQAKVNSLIIPGTATGPDHPLAGPERSTEKTTAKSVEGSAPAAAGGERQ